MRRERYLWFSGESQRLFFARARRACVPLRVRTGYGGMCVWCWWSLMCLSLACLEAPRGRRRLTVYFYRNPYRVWCVARTRTYQIPLVCSVRYLVRKEMCKAAPMAVTLSETHPHTPHTAGGARGHTRATAPARATQHHSSSPSTHCGHTGYQVAWVHSFCGPRCRDTPATVLAAGHGP